MDNTNNTSGPSSHGKKMLWFFVAVGALAILAIAVVAAISPKNKVADTDKADQANTPPPVEIEVEEIAETTRPDFFPADMPSETGAEIVKNFNTTAADGRQIGTRVYVTARSIDENYGIFQSYFEKGGWQVTEAPPIQGSDSKTMIATKDKMQAQVTIGDDPVAKARTVAIIFTQSPN